MPAERSPERAGKLAGIVVAAYGRHYEAEMDNGDILSAVTRGKKGGVACGDKVIVEMTAPGQAVIVSIEPRKSLLYRSDAFREKIIAANVTQIVIVVAPVPTFYDELVSRCLAAAEASGIKALIVLNKADLEPETHNAQEQLSVYRRLGYAFVLLSAKQDVTALRPYLKGETSVLVGQSGMGKSTIINGLLPEAQARTREISEFLDSGKHTTTHARLYHLDDASAIIDSPGLQEFGLMHFDEGQLMEAFVEFRPFLGHCKFSNCKHVHEPGCAVLQAAEEGKIEPRRLAVYQRLIHEREQARQY